VLVLTAAIARNYDQVFILENPWWPVGPLVFRLSQRSSSTSLFMRASSNGSVKGGPVVDLLSQFVRFLGVFWMTAPLAWLYAIPVERFLASYPAAVVNVALLAVVASWRVWLLSRALAVLLEIQARDALLCVLLAASLELVLVSLAGCLSFVEIMGGLRHSPERILIANVTAFAFWGGLIIAVVGALLSRGRQTRPGAVLPPPSKNGFPFFLLALLAIWMAVAVLPQREVARNFRLEHFLQEKRYADALNFLSTFQRSDFAASAGCRPIRHISSLPPSSKPVRRDEWFGSRIVRWEYLGHLEIA
jgi:hypothetical protein